MRLPRVRFTATTEMRGPARWWVHLTSFLAALVATQIILPAAVYDSEVHRCGTSESVAVSLLWLIGTAYAIALFLFAGTPCNVAMGEIQQFREGRPES